MTCLAKKPIVRDPHIFDRKEAARGSRAGEVTCRIQKWNIKAEGFHPILVANARVDWLAMDDDDITKKKHIVRDPHIFDRQEAAKGSRAREVTCRIQKWNIQADGFHPILVANARVDWLAMKDDDITKKFPILLEGILQDVFSQRASSAWQGAQPQKLTVSMLLPGTSSASEWRDLLQSRRQFWPTLTTRHASLVPVSADPSTGTSSDAGQAPLVQSGRP